MSASTCTRPNILFFIADDHRFDALGCNGDTVVQTPNLDALAAAGSNFGRAFTMGGLTGAVCIPSRAMLHTGRGTFRTGPNRAELMTLKPENITLGQTLGNAGYRTHGIGKWHNDQASFNRSFQNGSAIFMGGMHDQWLTPLQNYDATGAYNQPATGDGNRHSTDIFCDSAIDFLNNYEGEQPFFLYVSFTSPHDPRTAPASFHDLYQADQMPLPPNFMAQHPFDNGDLHNRDEELAAFSAHAARNPAPHCRLLRHDFASGRAHRKRPASTCRARFGGKYAGGLYRRSRLGRGATWFDGQAKSV